MRITKITPQSKCKDGSLVKEFTLSSPVVDKDISALQRLGDVTLKDIAGNILFTYFSDIISLKGMMGDTVIYVTHKKEEGHAVEVLMYQIFR